VVKSRIAQPAHASPAVTGEKPPGLRRAAFCAICGSSAHVLSAVAADWPSAMASGGAALSAQVAAAR